MEQLATSMENQLSLSENPGSENGNGSQPHDASNRDLRKNMEKVLNYQKEMSTCLELILTHIKSNNTETDNNSSSLETGPKEDTMEKILSNQSTISQQLTSIIFTEFQSNNTGIDNNSFPLEGIKFPLKNWSQLKVLETKLCDYSTFKSLIHSFIGEEDEVKKMVEILMSKLFTKMFLSEFNYTKKTHKGKRLFSNLKVCSVIHDAIKEHKFPNHVDENEIKDQIKKVFHNARC